MASQDTIRKLPGGRNKEPCPKFWQGSNDRYSAAVEIVTDSSWPMVALAIQARPGRMRRAEVDGKLQPTAAATAYLKG